MNNFINNCTARLKCFTDNDMQTPPPPSKRDQNPKMEGKKITDLRKNVSSECSQTYLYEKVVVQTRAKKKRKFSLPSPLIFLHSSLSKYYWF